MVYRFLRWLTRITLDAYFRKVVITGKNNIPAGGPVIFVANHPSAFMDPMVIGTCTNRSLHFVAAGEYIGSGLKSWIYRKQLHMIPVYRPTTMPGESYKNEKMFSQCYDLLVRGGSVLIFPEGNSITEKRVRKLKTGAARMALGTRDYAAGELEVSIVPIGLNYANPHRFQSEVFVNIGEPISTKGFTSDREGVAALTDEIELRLREAVLHVQHQELDSVIKKAELIMRSGPGLAGKAGIKQVKREQEFQGKQRLIQSMHTVHEANPEIIREIEDRLDAYLGKIRQMGIADSSIAALSPISTPTERLRLWVGRPLFIVGFFINAIPYYLTVFLFRMLNLVQRADTSSERSGINPAFRGSIAISIGMVVFSNWYIGWAVLCALATGLWWIAFVALLFFYLAGLFTLRYIGWTLIADQKSRIRRLLGRGSHLYSELIVERLEIFRTITKVTQEFQPQNI